MFHGEFWGGIEVAHLFYLTYRRTQILEVGYDTIEAMLEDVKFSLFLLLISVVVKTIVAAISLDRGLIGGIFASAMFFGEPL